MNNQITELYGWIAISTNQILAREAILGLVTTKAILHNNDVLIDPPDFAENKFNEIFNEEGRNAIRRDLNVGTVRLFFMLHDFADNKNPEDCCPVIFQLNNNDLVSHMWAYKYPGYNRFLTANISINRENALVEYSIDAPDIEDTKGLNKHIYGIIRGIYHEHIYAHQTDFPLLPVVTTSEEDAIEKIHRQYQKKIIWYTRAIKKAIHEMKMVKFNRWIKLTIEPVELIHHAQGEMIYAKSFANKFNLPEINFNFAIESLSILSKKVESIKANIQFEKTIKISFIITFSSLICSEFGIFKSYKSIFIIILIWLVIIFIARKIQSE